MEIKESETSQAAQKTFSASIEVMGEYFIKIAIVELPWIGLPVIKQVFSYVIKSILSKVHDEGQIAISFAFIDREIDNKRELYQEAVTKLKEVLETDVPEDKKNEALEETKKRLRDLIRFPVR